MLDNLKSKIDLGKIKDFVNSCCEEDRKLAVKEGIDSLNE